MGKIRSGEVPRYTGMVDCASRIMKEQGFRRFWDGNLTNCIRYFPTQAFNLAFKDTFKKMFPKYDPKTQFAQFFGANLVSGGLAAAGSMTIVYPLDYSRTRLASDVGSGKKTFSACSIACKRLRLGLVDSWLFTLVSACPWSESLGTVVCSWVPSTQSLASILTRKTRVLWVPCPPSLQHKLRSLSVQEPRIPLTLCVDDCRCSRKNPWKNTSTRVPWTASRRLLPRRAWQKVCTRDSLRTWSAALVVPWSSFCTIVRRCTSVSEA